MMTVTDWHQRPRGDILVLFDVDGTLTPSRKASKL
jgi:hypothetical protein